MVSLPSGVLATRMLDSGVSPVMIVQQRASTRRELTVPMSKRARNFRSLEASCNAEMEMVEAVPIALLQ